jgi:predicted nuclease of predicted toxin-antitoxin system
MKFLIDAQLPRRLAGQIQQAGLEATHTLELPDGNRTTDQTLTALSITDQAVLITKDSDFVQSFLLRNEPWKLLLVSTGNIRNNEPLTLFERNMKQVVEHLRKFDFVEINRTSIICPLIND